MPNFPIQSVQRFSGQSTTIKRPNEIACFSYDKYRKYSPDASSLKYYYPPNMPTNLSKGYETFKKRDDTPDEHLDGLLKTIKKVEQDINQQCKADIVTWRGLVTKIMITPYDYYSDYEMYATWYQGTIFIEENHTYKNASQMKQKEMAQHNGITQDLMQYWGYKFESLSVLDRPWEETSRDQIEGRDNDVVDNHEQYCSVVQTDIGGTSLIIGGEVDAVWDSKPDCANLPINWVELKTAQEIYDQKSAINFDRKLLRIWAQSFLLGVPKVIVGFRSEEGTLLRIEEIDTKTIPGRVRRNSRHSANPMWDANICIDMTSSFLNFLREFIKEPGVWKICKKLHDCNIEVLCLHNEGCGKILSAEFLQWRAELNILS